jgi:hypothetical protein
MESVQDNKYWAIQDAIRQQSAVPAALKKWVWHMSSMLHLLMNLAVDCSAETAWSEEWIRTVSETYGVPSPLSTMAADEIDLNAKRRKPLAQREVERKQLCQDYLQVLHRAYQICCDRVTGFDFTDMVYLPVRLGLPLIQYDVILVDESQDLNAIQMEMIARSLTTR